MRITFLLPTVGFSGGIRVVAIYADWLTKRGHNVTLISPPPQRVSLKRAVKKWLTGRGWPKYQRIVGSHVDGRGLNHVVLDAHRPPRAGDVKASDVIVATWWETAEWLMGLPDHLGAKAHLIQHHEVFESLRRERCEATYRLPLHKIVVAKWLKDLMRNFYDDCEADLVVNGVDHDLFFAPVRSKQASPTVGVLYHEAGFKGFDVVLGTLEKLKCQWPDLRVVAFGSDEPSGVYVLPNYVELHVNPRQEALRGLYARCDVWLTTSRSEGFNLMAMEAMACRTPVVSTRTGWPAEAVRDGVNGYLVDIDDAAAAAQAAHKVLVLSDCEWRVMSDQAFATVRDATWETSCQLFERALRRAIKRADLGEIAGKATHAANKVNG